MTTTSDHKMLLQKNYTELPVSASLKRSFALLKCNTLEELLKNKASELLASKGFGAKGMKELYQYLLDNKMEDYLIEA